MYKITARRERGYSPSLLLQLLSDREGRKHNSPDPAIRSANRNRASRPTETSSSLVSAPVAPFPERVQQTRSPLNHPLVPSRAILHASNHWHLHLAALSGILRAGIGFRAPYKHFHMRAQASTRPVRAAKYQLEFRLLRISRLEGRSYYRAFPGAFSSRFRLLSSTSSPSLLDHFPTQSVSFSGKRNRDHLSSTALLSSLPEAHTPNWHTEGVPQAPSHTHYHDRRALPPPLRPARP